MKFISGLLKRLEIPKENKKINKDMYKLNNLDIFHWKKVILNTIWKIKKFKEIALYFFKNIFNALFSN